jgi:hypothetical protein
LVKWKKHTESAANPRRASTVSLRLSIEQAANSDNPCQNAQRIDLSLKTEARIVSNVALEVSIGSKGLDARVVRRRPSVVQGNDAALLDTRRPVAPVPKDAFIRVVTVDEYQVEPSADLAHGLMTEGPDDLDASSSFADLSASDQRTPADAQAAAKKRIHGIEHATWIHAICDGARSHTLVHSNLDSALLAMCYLSQAIPLGQRRLSVGLVKTGKLAAGMPRSITGVHHR